MRTNNVNNAHCMRANCLVTWIVRVASECVFEKKREFNDFQMENETLTADYVKHVFMLPRTDTHTYIG